MDFARLQDQFPSPMALSEAQKAASHHRDPSLQLEHTEMIYGPFLTAGSTGSGDGNPRPEAEDAELRGQ